MHRQHRMAEIAEHHGWRGSIRVSRVEHATGRILEVVEFENLIVDQGLNLARDAIRGGGTGLQILYVAIGDDASAPAGSDQALGNERFRKQVTAYSTGGTGVVTSTVYIAPSEANFTWEEIGWFAGQANESADSGALVARVNFNTTKSQTESIQIDRTDTFA